MDAVATIVAATVVAATAAVDITVMAKSTRKAVAVTTTDTKEATATDAAADITEHMKHNNFPYLQ